MMPPNASPRNLPAYRSIALRLPIFFALALLGVAIAAVFSAVSTIRDQSLALIQTNLDTVAHSEADRLAQLLQSQIVFLDSFTNDENIQLQLITSNSIFENTLRPPQELVADWQTVWADALRQHANPTDSPFIQTTLRSSVSQELARRTFTQSPIMQDGLIVVNKYGALFGTNYVPRTFDYSQSAWFQALQNGEEIYLAGRVLDRQTPSQTITEIALPIYSNRTGELLGFVRGAFDFDHVKQIVEGGRFAQTGRVAIRDGAGEIVYSVPLRNSVRPYQLTPIPAEDFHTMSEFLAEDGVVYFVNTSPLESNTAVIAALNWYISAYQPRADALAPITEAVPRAVGVAALFTGLVVTLLYTMYIRPLTRDMGKLQTHALNLQQTGDTRPLILGRDDELGVLSSTINQMTRQIGTMLQERERVIAERTADLERRANQLEATMLIGRAASSSLNLELLMEDVVYLIRDRADYYHASIFLLDDTKEYAVVRESTGEVGQILKSRPHKLAVGSNSIVGQATQRREPVLARNVGDEFSYFNNPLLPETKSEVALPLLYQGELLGALDVQSQRLDAFTPADLAVLQLMGDQVAAAIANARLYQSTLTRTEQQRQVIQLWKQLDGMNSTADILHALTYSLVHDFGYQGAYIAELEHHQMTIVASAAKESKDHIRLGIVRPITDRGPVGMALEQGGALLIPRKDPSQPHSYDLDFVAVQSETISPIYIENKATHVLSLYSHTPNQIQTSDQTLLELIAEAAGSALYNTALHNEQERNLRELNQLYQQTVQYGAQDMATLELSYAPPASSTPTNAAWQPYTIPLTVRDQLVGEVVVESQRPWGEDERNVVQTIADQTAYALENSRLFAQTQLRLQEQAALFELTNSLTSTLDVPEIYRRATQAFTEQLRLGRCTLCTWDRRHNTLTVRAEYVLDPTDPAQTGHYTRFEVRPLNEYPAASEALRRATAVSRHHTSTALSPAERTLFAQNGQTTFLEIPLIANQITLGLLTLYRGNQQLGFNDLELRLAQAMASQTASALQNGLLAERTRTQVTQLSSLNRLSRRLTLANSLREIFETVRQELLDLTNATGMAISLITPENKVKWSYAFEYGQENDISMVPPQEMNVGFTGHVLTTREPLLLNKYTNIEEMTRKMRSIRVGVPPNAWLGVPMFAMDKLIGALTVENGEDADAFSDTTVELMTTVSSTVAIAISNLRQVEAIRLQRQEAERLYVTGQRIGTAVSSNEILLALAQSELIPAVQGLAIYTFNDNEQDDDTPVTLTVYARWERQAAQFGSLCRLDQQLTAADWPFLRQLHPEQPLLYEEIHEDERLDATSQRLLRQHNTHSAAFLPIVVGQTWLGVLAVYGTEPGQIDHASVQRLTSLTNQIGAAVQNRRLLRQTQGALLAREQQSLQLQTAAQVAAAASTSSLEELQTLFQTVVDLIQDRFGLYYVGLFLIDEPAGVVRLAAGTGAEGAAQIAAKRALPLGGNSLVGNTSIDGRPRIRQNVFDAPDWLPNPFLPDTRSEIALALRVRGRNIGALTVQSATFNSFSDDLVRTLQTMSDQIAVAIDNTYLFTQVQTNLNRTQALYTATQHLFRTTDEMGIFDVLLDFTRQSGLFQGAGISVPDPQSDQHVLVIRTWQFGDERELPIRFASPFQNRDEVREPYLILHGDEQKGLFGPTIDRWLDGQGAQSGAIVRLNAQNRWVATWAFIRTNSEPITPADLQPFLSLADQAMVVLANQQLLKETSALYRLGRSLSSAITQEDVARVTIEEIADYTGMEQGRVIFFNQPQGRATVVAAHGLPETALSSWPLGKDTAALLTNLQQHREALWVVDDKDENEEMGFVVAQFLRPWGVRAALLLPVISQEVVTALITLDALSEGRVFTQDNINFAQAAVAQFTTTLENIIFFDESRNRAQELITLNQISTRISSTLNTQALAEIVYSEITQLIEPDVFLLAEFSPHDLTYAPRIFALHGQKLAAQGGKIAKTDPLHVILHAGKEMILDTADDLAAEIFGLLGDEAMRQGHGRIPPHTVFIPMVQEGRPRGFLAVQAYESYYSAENINLLRGISTQAVLGFSNARLFRETQESVAELRTQFNVTQSIASSIDAESRMARMVESLHHNLRQARVAILLAHEGETELEVVEAYGYPAEGMPRYTRHTGLVGKVVQYNNPLMMGDVRELGETPPPGTVSQLAVPLVLGQRVIGVLNVESGQRDAFSDRDLRLLQTLSVSLAATVESGRLFAEIQSANEQLRELDKMKTQFLANMSHELRTPLNSIIGFSRLILKGIDGPINPMQEEDLTSIYNSGQHLLNLINDILDLAKMDAGKMALVFDRVDLNELCQSVLATAKGLVKNDRIELVWNVQQGLPIIEADPVRMRQILLNLLSNAAKFTDEGSISLSVAQADEEYVQISVKDTGIGIAEEHFPRLFQAFEQVDSSDSRKVGGTGLGLPIVYELVLLHGGKIWLESQLGHGSTFYVRLPIHQTEIGENDMRTAELTAAQTPSAPTPELPSSPAQPAVVVVDGQPGMLALYERYLNGQPFELLRFTHAEQALAAMRQRPQDILLVVVDEELPDMSGWDMWQALREDPALHRVPIALCTLHDTADTSAVPDSLTYLLPKPIIATDLLGVIGF